MGRLRTIAGWLAAGAAGVTFVAVGYFFCVLGVVLFAVFCLTGEVPTFHQLLSRPPQTDNWTYRTPETPILFKVEGNAGCMADVTLGVIDGETLHVAHQMMPFEHTLNVGHGRKVYLVAQSECDRNNLFGGEIIDRMRPIAGGTCYQPRCRFELKGRVK